MPESGFMNEAGSLSFPRKILATTAALFCPLTKNVTPFALLIIGNARVIRCCPVSGCVAAAHIFVDHVK